MTDEPIPIRESLAEVVERLDLDSEAKVAARRAMAPPSPVPQHPDAPEHPPQSEYDRYGRELMAEPAWKAERRLGIIRDRPYSEVVEHQRLQAAMLADFGAIEAEVLAWRDFHFEPEPAPEMLSDLTDSEIAALDWDAIRAEQPWRFRPDGTLRGPGDA